MALRLSARRRTRRYTLQGRVLLLLMHHCLLKKFPYDLDYIDLSRDEFLDCRNGEPLG